MTRYSPDDVAEFDWQRVLSEAARITDVATEAILAKQADVIVWRWRLQRVALSISSIAEATHLVMGGEDESVH